ncbi:MAG: aminotransferase class I/II-fold pyridoxal phosphate-dependent enzyme [Flavobacteriales bacterium]|nr:aminotransferase class I/II-fold pyridoxal phosphate-dependent enzyme [Flavobacteriales bacterium]
MIATADRLGDVKEYYFSVKLAEIKAMNEAGNDVINLGIGSPDMAPSKNVLEASSKSLLSATSHGYQSYKGTDKLRNAISDWYKRFFNVSLNPNSEILPLTGSKEGIIHISMAFLNPGDGVLIPNPGYPTYKSVSDLVQANIISYPLDENNNWEPDFDYLESLDLSKVKIMWVNYPNMPTGADANFELFRKLIKFGKKNNILIVNDNPYSFVLNENQRSILSIDGADEVALELNSLSKASNMAGWRIGMLVGNDYYIKNVLRVKSNMDSGMFLALQEGAVEALKLDSDWYNKLNDIYRERKTYAHKLFDLIGCKYRDNEVGMFVWAKVPEGISAEELSDIILEKSNVFITPGMIFGSNGNSYLRISLCTPKERIEEAIQRVSKIEVNALAN